MLERLPKGWARTTLGEVCAMNPRISFGGPLLNDTDVIFAKITPCMENGKIALATGLKNGIPYGAARWKIR